MHYITLDYQTKLGAFRDNDTTVALLFVGVVNPT